MVGFGLLLYFCKFDIWNCKDCIVAKSTASNFVDVLVSFNWSRKSYVDILSLWHCTCAMNDEQACEGPLSDVEKSGLWPRKGV